MKIYLSIGEIHIMILLDKLINSAKFTCSLRFRESEF